MKGADFSPRGKVRHDVELAKQLAHHLTGIVATAELLELRHDARQRVLGLPDGRLRVILALLFEASGVFRELLAEELREALAGWSDRGPTLALHLDAR